MTNPRYVIESITGYTINSGMRQTPETFLSLFAIMRTDLPDGQSPARGRKA